MSFQVKDLGGGQVSNGGSNTVNTTNATTTVGDVILVCVTENTPPTPSTIGVVSDGSNTYNLATSITYGGGQYQGFIFYSWNSNALSSSTITYTKMNISMSAAMACLSISGARILNNPIELDNIGTSSGSGIPVSVSTHGISEMPAELYVGVLFGFFKLINSQDTGHSWAFPPTPISTPSGDVTVGGGYFVNPFQSILTYAPTSNNSNEWGMAIVPILPPKPTSTLLPQAHM